MTNIPTLAVRYISQISELDCGAAAFEMAYRYHRPSRASKFDRQRFFEKYRSKDPHSGQLRLDTNALLSAASNRGLQPNLFVSWPTVEGMVTMLKGLVYNDKVPVIVCQRASDKLAWSGHFRVVIGCGDDAVVFHDPLEGASITWPAEKFFDYFRRTGENVEGGVCAVVTKGEPLKTLVSIDQLPWSLELTKILARDGSCEPWAPTSSAVQE